MAEWEQLEELDSALHESGRRSSAKKKKRSSVAAPATDGDAALAAAAVAVDQNGHHAAVAAAVDMEMEEKGTSAKAAATSPGSAIGAPVVFVAASPIVPELDRLRAENAALRLQLAEQPSHVSTNKVVSCGSSGPRLTERAKASISFQGVSHRVRKYLDTIMMQAELNEDSRGEARSMDELTTRSSHTAAVQYFESFCIDRAGVRNCGKAVRGDMYQPLDFQLFDVPTYEGPINVVPLPVRTMDNGHDLDIVTMLGSCFNCGLNHQIRECPHPREETCIRVNSMLFREFAQGRNKTDGSIRTEGGGGRGPSGGSGYQGRYYTDENLKPEVEEARAATVAAEPEEGEIVLDEDSDSDAKPTKGAPSTDASGSSEYFMHSIHPTITHPTTAQLLAQLPKSDLQVIDRDEDELQPLPTPSPSPPPATPIAPRVQTSSTPSSAPVASASAAVTPNRSSREVIHIDDNDDRERQPKRARFEDASPARSYHAPTPVATPSMAHSAAATAPNANATPIRIGFASPSPQTPTAPFSSTPARAAPAPYVPTTPHAMPYPPTSSSYSQHATPGQSVAPPTNTPTRAAPWSASGAPPPPQPSHQAYSPAPYGYPPAPGMAPSGPPPPPHGYYPPQMGGGPPPPPPPPPTAYPYQSHPAHAYPPLQQQPPQQPAQSHHQPSPQQHPAPQSAPHQLPQQHPAYGYPPQQAPQHYGYPPAPPPPHGYYAPAPAYGYPAYPPPQAYASHPPAAPGASPSYPMPPPQHPHAYPPPQQQQQQPPPHHAPVFQPFP